jgi:hypothetical protein
MPKNKKGYCIISKKSFDPEKGMNKGIDKKRISAILVPLTSSIQSQRSIKKALNGSENSGFTLGTGPVSGLFKI